MHAALLLTVNAPAMASDPDSESIAGVYHDCRLLGTEERWGHGHRLPPHGLCAGQAPWAAGVTHALMTHHA